jgi:hypothetical protein
MMILKNGTYPGITSLERASNQSGFPIFPSYRISVGIRVGWHKRRVVIFNNSQFEPN